MYKTFLKNEAKIDNTPDDIQGKRKAKGTLNIETLLMFSDSSPKETYNEAEGEILDILQISILMCSQLSLDPIPRWLLPLYDCCQLVVDPEIRKKTGHFKFFVVNQTFLA